MRIRMGVSRGGFMAELQWTLFTPAGLASPSSGMEINRLGFLSW